MIKKLGFYGAALLLVTHGVTVGMMNTTKTLRIVKFNRKVYSTDVSAAIL